MTEIWIADVNFVASSVSTAQNNVAGPVLNAFEYQYVLTTSRAQRVDCNLKNDILFSQMSEPYL